MSGGNGDCPHEVCPLRELVDLEPQDAASTAWAGRWSLPPRLARVALLMMQGLSDRQIGESLGLANATIRTYVREIYGRASVNNRTALLRAALGGGREART